ncbi:HIT family protein [Agarivorans aestuarii]|uniref:HIT family protein n=1 Tax=Agarivorans aestuarii TaxID=1563703 RepID=UPI001C814282|nr:HIT family protein [Agarivorans aestuarii]
MSYDNNNIFAKILRGEMSCLKVYEDEHTLAFMDIMPQADGHTLVIPKEAAETLLDLSDDAAAATIKTVKKVAKAVKQAMDAEGVSLVQFNGAAAGQTVPHIHFHIIPGSLAEARSHARNMVDNESLQPFADKISALLAS